MTKLLAALVVCGALGALLPAQSGHAIDLKRKLGKIFLRNGPFAQLNELLSDLPDSADLAARLNFIGHYLHENNGEQANRAKNRQLTEAARQFAELGATTSGRCNPKGEQTLDTLAGGLARELGALSDPTVAKLRVVRLFRDAGRQYARSCVLRNQQELVAALGADEELREDKPVGRALATLQNRLKNLMCNGVYLGPLVSLIALDCALRQANESLANSRNSWEVYQTLESLQWNLDQEEASSNLDQKEASSRNLDELHAAAEDAQRLDQILERTIYTACQVLVDHPQLRPTISSTLQLTRFAPLSDELFAGPADQADLLMNWSSRFVTCRRLLERTDRQELREQLVQWIESRQKDRN